MEHKQLRWFFLIGLALVWGSSFILMKLALNALTPVQVESLRMIISALFLVTIGFHKIKLIRKRHWKYLILNAALGTFIPVFLFAFAVQNIDSSIVAILNSLTPLNTLILGFVFFGFLFQKKQILGIIIGTLGTLYLIMQSATLNPDDNYWYANMDISLSFSNDFSITSGVRYNDRKAADYYNLDNFFSQHIGLFSNLRWQYKKRSYIDLGYNSANDKINEVDEYSHQQAYLKISYTF